MKRLKHGLPVYSADRSHFHHRFFTIGWGQRKTVLALYAWCALMGAGGHRCCASCPTATPTAASRIARDPRASRASACVALLASVYLVYVLEILKWRSTPVVHDRAPEPPRPRRGEVVDALVGRRARQAGGGDHVDRTACRAPGPGGPAGSSSPQASGAATTRRTSGRLGAHRAQRADDVGARRRARAAEHDAVASPAASSLAPGAVGVNSMRADAVAGHRAASTTPGAARRHAGLRGGPEGLRGDARARPPGPAGRRRAAG